jgi:hypothetical protein
VIKCLKSLQQEIRELTDTVSRHSAALKDALGKQYAFLDSYLDEIINTVASVDVKHATPKIAIWLDILAALMSAENEFHWSGIGPQPKPNTTEIHERIRERHKELLSIFSQSKESPEASEDSACFLGVGAILPFISAHTGLALAMLPAVLVLIVFQSSLATVAIASLSLAWLDLALHHIPGALDQPYRQFASAA